MIVEEDCGVTVIGGGELLPETLMLARSLAPVLVAADGAAAVALELGWQPKAVIGDMDSLDEQTRRIIPEKCLHHIAEQESTDFDKCLRNISAPFVLGIGLLGARLDHELAVLTTLLRYPAMPCILLGKDDLCCLVPETITLKLPVGTRFSLFPFAELQAESSGLRWPLDGLSFAPDRRVATSNETNEPEVRLHFSPPKMLLILPCEHLHEIIRALSA